MKSNRINRFLSILRNSLGASAIVMSFCGLAEGASNTWTGATNAKWDTSTANWASPVKWSNGNAAVFPPGAGAVDVVENITISGLSISGGDSTVIGAGRTLLLDYATAAPAVDGGWSTHIAGSGALRLDSAQPLNGTANWGPNSSAALPFGLGFTGTLIVDNGRFDASPAGLGGMSALVMNNGAQFLGWSGVYTQPFSIAGDGWGEIGQPGALRVAAGNDAAFNGNVTLLGDAGINSQTNGSVVTLNGVVGGTGNLTIYARGRINFNGPTSETYTGSLRINTTGASAGTSHVTFNKPAGMVAVPAGATVDFGYGALDGQVNLRMAGSDQFGAGVMMNFNNPLNQWSRFDLMGTNQTLAGINSGTLTTQGGGVIQNREFNGSANRGTSTLTFNGNSAAPTYPPGGYVYYGYLRDADSGVNASNLISLVKAGTGTQKLVGSSILYSGLTTVNAGTLVFSKTNALNTSIENNATVEINSAGGDDWILNNNKTLSGGGTWNKTGPGRASFNSANFVTTGQFNILEGTLRNNNNLGNWTGSTASVNISSGAILDLFADAIYVNKLTGSGIVQNGFGNPSGQASGAAAFFEKFVVGVANGSSTFAGDIRNNAGTNLPGSGGAGGGLDLQKVGSGTLTLTGTLSYSGVTVIDSGTLEIGGSAVSMLPGAVSGSGNLLKSGGGTVMLGGANSFNGPTTITGGMLMITGTAPNTPVSVGGGGAFGAAGTGKTFSSLTLATGSKLSLPAAAAQTTNVGSLNLTGSPALTVTPLFAAGPVVGTYDLLTPSSVSGTAGPITTDFGVYSKARGVAGSTAFTGGKLVLTVTGAYTGAANLVWNNAGGNRKWSAVTPADNNFDNGGSASMFYDLDNVAFNGASPGTVSLVGTLYPGSVTVDSSAGDYTFGGSGFIAGPTGLVKSGSSALTINTSNSFTGGITLNAGTLTMGSAGALGASPALNFPSGSTGTLRLNGNPLTVSALNTGFPYISIPVVESGAASAGVDTLTANIGGDSVFNGILRDGGARALALTKKGTGDLTFSGSSSNAYSGDTALIAGRIGLSKSGGAVAITGDFIGDNGASPKVFTTENNQFSGTVMRFVNPGGDHVRFELLGTTQTLAGIDNQTANGRGVIQHKEQVTIAEISTQSTLVLNVAENATYYFDGYMRGNGSSTFALVKNGPGTQQLAGPNLTYTGGTTVSAGSLDFVSGNAMDRATGPWIINEGAAIKAVAAQNLYGGLTLNGGTLAGLGVPNVSYGHVVLGSNLTVVGTKTSVISADLRVGGGSDSTFTVAATDDPSGIDLDVTGKIGHLNGVAWSFMTKAGPGIMRFNNPALVSDIGRITLNEGKIIFQDMVAVMDNGGLINNATAELRTGAGVDVTYGSTMFGTGVLEKTGLGSFALTNTGSTLAGEINISGGTLSLPARGTNYGDIAVSSGGTLTVTGAEPFKAGGLDLNGGSTLEIRNFVSSDSNAPVWAEESLKTAGAVSVKVSGITKSGVYPLIFYPIGGSVDGAGVAALSLESPGRSVTGTMVDNPGNSSVDLNATVTPVIWKGNLAGGIWDIENTANWTFKSAATTYQEGDFLLFNDSAATFAVTLNETVEPTTLTFDNTTHDYSLGGSGSISGAATLTKDGGGMLTVTGEHDYTGGTTVSGGTLRLGDGVTNGKLASAIANESIVTFKPAPAGQSYGGKISGAGAVTKEGAGALTVVANSSYTGNISVNGGTLIANSVSSGTDTSLGKADNLRTITVNAGATLTFALPNVFGNHGTTSVPTLVVNGGTVTNADPANGGKVNNGLNNVVLNNGTLTSAVGNGLSVIESWRPGEYYGAWGINGNLTSTGISSISSASPFGVIMLRSNPSPTVFDVQSGTLTVSTPLQGGDADNSGLTKMGAGTLVLSAVNNYSKATIVSEGTVVLDGSLVKAPGTSTTPGQERTPSNITVNSGATLAGAGTATGTVTIETGGFVAPGNGSIAVLHTGSTAIGGTYNCDVGASTSDGLAITGDLDLTGATIAFSTAGTPAASSYLIASYTGSYSGGIPAATNLPVGYTLTVDGTSKQLRLVSSGGYSAWATLKGLNGTNNGLTQDPDFDGVSNQLEYYLNGNPLSGDSTAILPAAMREAGYLKLTFERRDDAEAEVSSQNIQYGTTLSAWPKSVAIGAASAAADANGVIVSIVENGANPDDITVRIPIAQGLNGKLFGRLKVTMP